MENKNARQRFDSADSEDDHIHFKKEKPESTEKQTEAKQKIERVNRNARARLLIRNVSFKATDDTLKEHFASYGDILEAKLLKKPNGNHTGCAFVHFRNVPMAKKALLNTNMKPFLGRPISVDWAAKNKSKQHVVNQEQETAENIQKEESDSD